MADLEAIRAHLANEVGPVFERQSCRVYRRRVDLGLTESKPQFRHVGDLLDLPARRLEQDGCPHSAMDASEEALAVCIESACVGLSSGDVGADRSHQPRLPELSKDNTAELLDVQGRRAERDQGLASSLLEAVLESPRDPLGEHGQRSACLLVLNKGRPLALKDGQGRRVERVTGIESGAEEVPSLGLSGRAVDGCPLWRKLRPALEAPIGIGLRHLRADAVVAQVVEEAAPYNLADLRFVVRDEILCDSADHFRDLVLPL